MRSPLIVLVVSLTNVCAQDQERSLIDRLLRPNMELQNPQQGKVFRPDSKVTAHAESAKGFVSEPASKQKTFAAVRNVERKEYRSHSVRANPGQNAVVETRQINVPAQVASSPVHAVHFAYDAHLDVSSQRFADEHSFRDQGKSQKSLSRENPPLTIDQVRELLNKNK